MRLDTLLTLLRTPYANTVVYQPLHHKRRFVCDTANTVKHEDKQYIKLLCTCQFFDFLYLITVFRSYLVPGNTFLLQFIDDLPTHPVAELAAGFSLHGNIRLVLFIVVHLLTGRNTVQAQCPQLLRRCLHIVRVRHNRIIQYNTRIVHGDPSSLLSCEITDRHILILDCQGATTAIAATILSHILQIVSNFC